ncbi:MAG: efflux RND transporter periplasmic adaptor subunit [Alphaproteobacteria bacterium]|nr:MAG: efflux RND transporter periplasmic adaptor subunit [Alphaproteobacteria bacterium]
MRIIILSVLLMLCLPIPAVLAEDTATYICPMHPHIHGQKGDNCPICGMFLAPQENEAPAATTMEKNERKILYWVAPMDPNYRQDHPGKSPMGMDLVPVYEEESSAPEGAIQIAPTYQQALGVKTEATGLHEFGARIDAHGHIEASTREQHVIAVRTSGWITELRKDAIGDTVKKGDLLFSFYSPDLMSAQADYLVGRRSGRPIGDTEGRLRLYGMDNQAIKTLQKAGHATEKTPFHAPADGVVASLPLREGSFANAGETVLVLQDYQHLWVMAHVPLRDVQMLHEGENATVMLDETGKTFTATIETILPATDPLSRTAMVRLLLDNTDGSLKTKTLVHVMFETGSKMRLSVPAEAVLYGKDIAYVIEDVGNGYFRPVHVQTGVTAKGMTEIISGLQAGQNVVVTGQFMIDAESTLRGGLSAMNTARIEDGNHAHKH